MSKVETPGEVLADLLGTERGRQAALARACGVKPQTVTKWLTEQTGIPVARWPAIEAFLGAAPLTFARRTGLLDSIPGLEESIPLDWLYEARWMASFPAGLTMSTRRRRDADDGPPSADEPVGDHESRISQLEDEVRSLQEAVAQLLGRALKDANAGTQRDRRPKRAVR